MERFELLNVTEMRDAILRVCGTRMRGALCSLVEFLECPLFSSRLALLKPNPLIVVFWGSDMETATTAVRPRFAQLHKTTHIRAFMQVPDEWSEVEPMSRAHFRPSTHIRQVALLTSHAHEQRG